MNAFVYETYGPPKVLKLVKVPKPKPKKNEVLIKIHASTVNRTDCGFRQGKPLIVRLFSGLFYPKKKILGSEFAGQIEATGNEVSSFKIGDKIFGLSTFNFGTHAEYICLPENGTIALMPENMNYKEAAAVCDGLFLAYNYIKRIDFSTSPKILINGASGSIGTAAVQLAKYFGGEITAVCNTKNIDLVKSLGAQEVIDYGIDDFTASTQTYDVILDAVGKSSFFKCQKIIKPKGIYYSTELGYLNQNLLLPFLSAFLGGKKVGFPIPKVTKTDIEYFKQLIEDGHYRAILDRIYHFSQIIEATKYVETGEKTGNVVISI
jgi:NADPH:quinone reductase-like Zn-dependent oxidoreductase